MRKFSLIGNRSLAAAVLFDEFDRHGIPIEVPDLWAANRLVNEIRRAQAKLRAKSGT